MNPFRSAGVPNRAVALLTGGALLTGLVAVPAIPASAATTDPSPSPSVTVDQAEALSITVNGEVCGDEPVWHSGTGDYVDLAVTATFAAPTTERAVLYALVGADGVDLTRFIAPVEDGVAATERPVRLAHGTVSTLEVRLRSGDAWATEPVASCVFGVRQPPVVATLVPVLGAGAVYVYGEARGGVGVAGQYLVVGRQGEAVAYEYAVTGAASRPTTWESISVVDGGPAPIPVVPAATGRQYLHVRGIDEYGARGPWAYKSFLVGTADSTRPAPPAITVRDLDDWIPDDGRIPLDLTLTNDLAARPMGEVVLRHGTQEVGRATFDAQSETVLVEQAGLGTGFQEITAEYRQFEGAPTVTRTARICAANCAFTGGKVVVTALGDVRLDPNLLAEVSGFSPKPTSYTYEWLRAGKVVSSGGSDEDAHYLSLPPDEGHTLTARVTAHGPRMTDKTVTASVRIGDRAGADVCAGGKAIGTRWLRDYRYCSTSGDGRVGDPGSGRSLEMLVAEPSPGPGYVYSTAGESDDPNVAYWFDQEGYVQGRGWEGLKRKDDVYYVGSVGQNLRLEAFRIDDGGKLAPYYDVWYRAYTPKHGWLGWAKNGESAGTTGYGYRLEAVQVRVLPKGTRPSASGTGNAPYYNKATQYQVTVQPYLRPSGWKSLVHGGSTAGLTDTSQRLNAVRVDVDGVRHSGGVQVSAKVEGDGWRSYVRDTKVAGTYDRTDRTSAYKMRLTGEMAQQYDIYYRVHVAGIGWLGWAKNGGGAGTESYRYRNTAVQVVLVKKGERPLMSAYGRAAYRR